VSQGSAIHDSRRSSGSPVCFAVIEPGTTVLRLLVIEVIHGQATVLGWAQGPGWATLSDEPQQLAAACADALRSAEAMAQTAGDRWVLPDQLVVGLPASQLRGRASSITQQRSRVDRPVEEGELESLLERVLRLSVNQLLGTDLNEEEWLLVDAALVAIKVEGRGVTDPVGFRGREMGSTVFAALAEVDTVRTWGLVARELDFSTLTLTATPLALAAGLPTSQGLLIDIGGATSELIWCRSERPLAVESLPIGGNSLTRGLARKWSLSLERAARLLQAYCGGRLDEQAGRQVQAVLWPVLQEWLKAAEQVLATMNQEALLPQDLYLAGGGSYLPEMESAVRSLAWSQRLEFVRYPQVHRLRPTDIAGVVNRSGLGNGPGDVAPLALAAWVAKQQLPANRPARIIGSMLQG
jgi:cell division ATPase FtsA